MNKTAVDARLLFDEMLNIPFEFTSQVIIIPPSVYLSEFTQKAKGSKIKIGCQNTYHKPQGAYTGEVSADILASLGVTHCLVGHSERRKYFNVSDQLCLEKVKMLVVENISPILCVGEELEVRERNKQIDVVRNQINSVFKNINRDDVKKMVVAYEPVWAIGTGKTATAKQAGEMHGAIREMIAELFGANVAEKISIIYGGSATDKNAKELLNTIDIDGLLVGGASLKSDSFHKIIEAGG